jgi:hypothetical protein
MATGPEHYQMAERILAGKPTDYVTLGGEHVTALPPSPQDLAAAQVHATLALVAVHAEPIVQRHFGDDEDEPANAASDLAWVRAVT